MTAPVARPPSVRRIAFDDLDPADRVGYEAAFEQADTGLSEGGVPVGSSIVRNGEVIASGRNRRVQEGDPIAHGEMNALRLAGRQPTYRDVTLHTTLAPCMMCTGTIIQFKIPRIVVGEAQTFPGNFDVLAEAGVEILLLDHGPSIDLMTRFQTEYPEVWAEDIAEDTLEDTAG